MHFQCKNNFERLLKRLKFRIHNSCMGMANVLTGEHHLSDAAIAQVVITIFA